MKVTGNGFKFFLDGEQLKNFDEFEKKISKIEVKEITVDSKDLIINARTR